METTTKMTQCDRVLRHINDHGEITSNEAMAEYGIHRLASRIHDLKKRGYVFAKETRFGKNRYGEPTHYTVYSLADNGGN